ncbi:hypothetical protein BH10PSE7_BH10PSE7_40190 [soil metagenome]
MAWIWADDLEDADFVGNFDYEVSTFRSSQVLSRKPLPADSGKAVMVVDNANLADLARYQCLPTTGSAPVVHSAMAALMSRVASSLEVQFYPVTVRAVDGQTQDYRFVIPLNTVTCTDPDKSIIRRWLVPGKSASGFKGLCHFADCLGNLCIARDSILEHVVVSDTLKSLLEDTGDPGLIFKQPEEMLDFYGKQYRARAH